MRIERQVLYLNKKELFEILEYYFEDDEYKVYKDFTFDNTLSFSKKWFLLLIIQYVFDKFSKWKELRGNLLLDIHFTEDHTSLEGIEKKTTKSIFSNFEISDKFVE
jgi:hypothetical protein